MKTKNCILAKRFYLDQSGNTAIEYAIIVTLLAAVLTPIIHGAGIVVSTKLTNTVGGWQVIDSLPPMP